LVRQKGVHRLAPIAKRLQALGTRLRFGVVGDGQELEAVKNQCRAAGVEALFQFFGRVDDDDRVAGLMKGAKTLLYPAAMEGGWSLTALEAQACGIPVVTAREGPLGFCECVIDGYNGLLAEDEDADSLAAKVAVIARDPGLQRTLGANAVEFARQLDWDKQARLVEATYRTALTSWYTARAGGA
jgi:glycosyltransferase involved in cell wall biosynthesis